MVKIYLSYRDKDKDDVKLIYDELSNIAKVFFRHANAAENTDVDHHLSEIKNSDYIFVIIGIDWNPVISGNIYLLDQPNDPVVKELYEAGQKTGLEIVIIYLDRDLYIQKRPKIPPEFWPILDGKRSFSGPMTPEVLQDIDKFLNPEKKQKNLFILGLSTLVNFFLLLLLLICIFILAFIAREALLSLQVTSVATIPTPTVTFTPTTTFTPTVTFTPTPTSTPSLDAQAAAQATFNAEAATKAVDIELTRLNEIANLTKTATLWTHTPTFTNTPTPTKIFTPIANLISPSPYTLTPNDTGNPEMTQESTEIPTSISRHENWSINNILVVCNVNGVELKNRPDANDTSDITFHYGEQVVVTFIPGYKNPYYQDDEELWWWAVKGRGIPGWLRQRDLSLGQNEQSCH